MEPTFLPTNRGVRVLGLDDQRKNMCLHDEITDELFWKPVDQCVLFQGDSVLPPVSTTVPKNVKRKRKRRFKPPSVQLSAVGKRVNR